MIGMCRTVASPWIAFCVTSPDGLRPRPRRWNYRPPQLARLAAARTTTF